MRILTPCLFLVAGLAPRSWADPPAAPAPQPATVDEAAVRSMLRARHGPDEKKFAAAGGYSPAAIPLYARILTDPEEDRLVVAGVLLVLRHPEMKGDRGPVVDPCVARLADPHVGVRLFAAELLGVIGAPRDLAPVAVLLSDKDSLVLFAAARALAAAGDRRALAAMDVWLAVAPPHATGPSTPEKVRKNVTEQRDKLKVRLDKEEQERAKKTDK